MRRFLTTLLVIVLVALVAGATACSRPPKGDDADSTPMSAEETASVDATQTGVPTQDGDAADADADSPDAPASKEELTDIQAELSAIEKELGSMDMPSDSDFSDIESSLR